MKKMSKHIVLSFAVSSLLFSQAYALPSGGKFTHGTTGSISSSNGTMNITGNKGAGSNGNNFVIQWGGGFNIGQNETVKFNGNQQNYLNIAYQKDASKIDGALNGGSNNIFLVNPMGVLIGKTGTITAGKFVASTTPLNDENVKTFLKQGASFSPAFDVSKQGNIINLGKINADNIVLIGNKVEIGVGAELAGQDGQTNAKTAHLIGNYVYISVGKENEKNTINVDSLKGTAVKEGFLQRDMTSFAGDGYVFGNFGTIEKTSYNETNSVDFTKAITIGGHYDGSQLDNETNANEWKFFADGWNRQNITGDIFKDGLTTIRLISDIDFNGYQAIDPVGAVIAFSGKFDGGGYTLKNLTIKAQTGNWNTGVFGKVEGTSGKKAQIYNLTVDNLKFSGKTNSGGGFVAQSKDAEFYNIHLKNYNDLNFYDFGNGQNTFGGGFVGYADSGSKFENITLENFGTITLTPNGVLNSKEIKSYLGGFAGYDNSGVYNNILLSGFKGIKIEAYGNGTSLYTGGFIGYSKNSSFRNITLNNFGNIYSGYVLDESNKMGQIYDSIAGGFAGVIDGNKLDIENISLNNFGDIEARRGIIYYQNASYLAAAGGFAGMIKLENQVNGNISNIFLNFDNNKIYAQKTISNTTLRSDYDYAGGFAGLFQGNNFSSNFVIGNIDLKFGKVNIDTYSKNGQSFNRGVFTGYIDSFRNINNIRIFYSNEDGGLKANPQSDYWDTNNRLGNLFTDITYDLNKKGDRVLYIYDDKSNENNEKVNNLIKEKFANLDNNGYVNFYNPSATNNPDIPNFKDPILSQNDFDPKLLQRILDDLMNGKYTYDFDTKTWTYTDSKGVVGENEASEITQSLNFLNAFKDTGVEQEFVNLWKNSQDQNYKNYANLYEKWTQKKTAMDKIKTGEGYFASFKEELQKYQEALAQLDKENKNYEKIKESGLVSDETLKVMYEKLLEQKEALEKQFADLSGNEGFHYKLENEILNSQGFSIEGKDVDDKAYTGNFNFKGKLASLPEKPNISIYEPDKQGGEDPDKPSVLPPEIPEKVVEAPIKIQTEVDTKKEEDDDQVEIGEADARSSGLRCIVSDNFKTMNICVNAK
ncbi:filamentous hemagglutinin N-terminal domain-containing protein [Campylobacter jejuni]|nr:filamentous hemagglutinin N-terminal domain-containing protein [Campylobacter jejuni]EDO8488424.1 filamentous hemagglutinin N-terminal domain-containing protein [Campylobacter jejuni]EDO8545372.1 filamentous hemagglutinin N-terminal domain-containing protein [Campylobacter jejuni]EDP7562274.1 filamentous hemagglutinin N-terminal domain-containing protein [Campylobacter jejuni]EFU9823921.1 filamentous hemagglutinin N-terminal domain-containing protein [Campylobacter jejuni]